MTNADKFKSLFGLYATELWTMPEKDFLKWINSEAINCSEIPNNWIPCRIKKHPDSKIECYVTVKDYTDNYGEEYDLIVDEDTYYPEHDAWDYYCDLDIIAWMPKNEPKEPYQPKEDES